MLFGYADESGEPGMAKSIYDYFVFCIVLFEDREAAMQASEQIENFRKEQGLSETHEFHYATDSKKMRASFSKFLKQLGFHFVCVSIKKTSVAKDASFERMATLITDILEQNHIPANIVMDTNPRLFKILRGKAKASNTPMRFSEKVSRGNNLIQVADYVTALKTRAIKHPNNADIAKMYTLVKKKCIDEIMI